MQQASEEEKTWYEPSIDFIVVEEFPTEHAVESREYFAYPGIDVGPHTRCLQAFRSTWVLQRRYRPSAPCPMSTPIPNGGMSQLKRSQIYNVYMRPWTFHMPWATVEFPHITHLDRILVEPDAILITTRTMARKQADPIRVMHAGHRAAWKHYVRGNVVFESSVTLITNLFSVCSAMAHHKDEDEERKEGDEQQDKSPPWFAGEARLSVAQLQTIIRKTSWGTGDKKATATSKTLLVSLKTGASM